MKVLVVFLFCIAFCQNAYANLIINGSFEDPNIPDSTWQWFTSNNVPGWQGSNIEIWDSLNGLEAYEGEQHAELNAHGSSGPFSIYQTFATNFGQSYSVTFAYAARSNNNEVFNFDVIDDNDLSIFNTQLNQHTVNNWSVFNTSFLASSALTTIRFTTLNTGTYGNFLDAVSVTSSSAQNNVSEPPGLLILTIIACLIGLNRYRRAKYLFTFSS